MTDQPKDDHVTDFDAAQGRGDRVIDITPSWAAILPVLIGVLQNRKAPAEAHREVEGELRRMALLADRYVRAVQNGTIVPDPAKGDTVAMSPVLGDPDQKES